MATTTTVSPSRRKHTSRSPARTNNHIISAPTTTSPTITDKLTTTSTFTTLVVTSIILRLILIVYGTWQDANFRVKYSDIDYFVVTDGAKRIWQGLSPYDRTTYRYSPLLALAVTPNIFLHPSFGKFVFVWFDLLTAWIIYKIGMIRASSATSSARVACLAWLWNPIALGISTRGSSDSIVCFFVCATILGLLQHHNTWRALVASAIMHGLSVHWRIYPIIFAPTILVYLNNWPSRIAFGTISGSTFLLLGLLSYAAYGEDFIRETFLYHVTRTDCRHNFSIWFYSLYLSTGKPSGFMMSMISFLPQVAVQVAVLTRFAKKDVLFSFCLQTMAFVTFNKVVTAQYFLWFICLLPQALERVHVTRPTNLVIYGVIPWLITELGWLFWAYRVEFLGEEMFMPIWGMGLAFFVVNVGVMLYMIIRHDE